MNACCTHTNTSAHYPRSHPCPANGQLYASVKRKTVLHHVLQPWHKTLTEQGYYFCTDPDCDVVYFTQDHTIIHTDELRTTVWQKSDDKNAAICYCFGITKEQALAEKNIKNFVAEQTKNSLCSCETSNPSGRCCLKDFPKS